MRQVFSPKEKTMTRRNLLTSAASAAAGAALFAPDPEAVWANGTKNADAKGRLLPAPFLETRDRAALFYKDWGAGKPVVFVHSWALNSDMWQYQMIHLSGKACAASRTISVVMAAPANLGMATITTRV